MTLRAESLTKRYRGFTAVDHASLEIERGEVVGLLGPNGAGKTTTFYMIVGLVHCTDGRIVLGEQDITQVPMHVRARLGVGYLPQEASVFRKMTVYENILAILEMRRDLKRRQRHEQTNALIDELNIGHCRDTLGMSLSGGERRRVEIARALAGDPQFMLLDEPFAGVDPISVIDIQRIVQHLRERDIGVLVTDHNVRETLGICARAYIISEGRMIAEGSPDSILTDPNVREVYLGHEFQL